MRKKRFLDTEDVSRVLGCCVESVRVYVREGKLSPVDGNFPYVFRREVVENFVRPTMGRPKKLAHNANE